MSLAADVARANGAEVPCAHGRDIWLPCVRASACQGGLGVWRLWRRGIYLSTVGLGAGPWSSHLLWLDVRLQPSERDASRPGFEDC
jgi:hypothetical protein